MKFSVITPSFKQLDHLSRCIVSVNDQTDVEVEHLIQDGGTQGFDEWYANIIAGLETSNCRIDAVSERDNGMYDAINRGWKRASGDVLCWLNCDEQYLQGALSKVAAFFKKHPDADMVFADVVLLQSDLKPYAYRRVVKPSVDFIQYCHLPVLSAGVFVKRQVIKESGFFLDPQWKAIGDAVWMANMLKAGIKAVCMPEPVAVFVRTGENLGETPLSNAEAEKWKASLGTTSPTKAKMLRTIHHFKKLFKGAYKDHKFDDAYYVDNLKQRERVTANLSWRW